MACIPLLSALGRTDRASCADSAGDRSLHCCAPPDDATSRVIIAGFGRVGETVASLLDKHRVAYVAVDTDADRVAEQRKARRPVYWGDITQAELLHRLHVETARALVVTMGDHAASDRLVATARAARPDLLIMVRARDARHAAHLYAIGATDAVPETHRGQPATVRGGAGGDRRPDGSGDRHHPRTPRGVAGRDQGDGAAGGGTAPRTTKAARHVAWFFGHCEECSDEASSMKERTLMGIASLRSQ